MSASLSLLVALGCTTPPTSPPEVVVPEPKAESPASDDADLLAQPLPDDPLQVTVHALSNGMRVYISPDPTTPRVDAHVIIRAGSRQEPPDATELAHYLEHMMFKGTDRLGTTDWDAERPHLEQIARLYDQLAEADDEAEHRRIEAEIDAQTQAASAFVVPNEIWKIYQSLGATSINARTGRELTIYDVWGLAPASLRTWAEVEAERFRAPAFRLFFPELEAVFEERNGRLDNSYYRAHLSRVKVAWDRHPNSREESVPEQLRTPAYAQMVAFYERWYVPRNMVVVLVGNVTPQSVLPLLEDTLGLLPSRPVPKKAREAVEGKAAGRAEQLDGDAALVDLVWTTVPVGHEDEPALLALNDLVTEYQSGLLVEMFGRTQRLASTWAGSDHAVEGGYWQVAATLREGQTHDEVERLLLSMVQRLRSGDFSEDRLRAIMLSKEVAHKVWLEDIDSRTDEIIESLADGRSWREYHELQQARREVTKDDIVAAARKYLEPSQRGIVRMFERPAELEHLAPPAITPLKLDTTASSRLGTELLARQYPPTEPMFAVEGTHYERSPLDGGHLITAHNPRNDLFEVTYRFERGSGHDPLLCASLDALDASGTTTRSPDALKDALTALGAQAWTECYERSTKLRFRGIDENFEATTTLVHQWLRQPAIDEEILDSAVNAVISDRNDDRNAPETMATALWELAMRGDKSPYQRAATDAQLRAMTAAGVGRRLAALRSHAHDTLYFGPRQPAEVEPTVALGYDPATPASPPLSLAYRVPSKPVIWLVDRQGTTVDIWLTYSGGIDVSSASASAFLTDEYLSAGMSGLLMQQLREAQGLVYTVGASTFVKSVPGDSSGLMVFMNTAPAKVAPALQTTLEALDRPVDEARFVTTKQAFIEQQRNVPLKLRDVATGVAKWRASGLREDPRVQRWRQLHSATTDPEAFERFRQELVAPAPVITIVGDRKSMDMAALRKLAKVRVVKPEALFGYR